MRLKDDFTKNEILELASEFKRRRNYLNLSQLKLAKFANISQSIINKLERGQIDPVYSTILKIDKALSEQEKISNLKASNIMIKEKDIFFLDPNMKIFEVIEIIRKYDFSQFLVKDKKKLLGTIYEKNLFDAISEKVDIYKTSIKIFIQPVPIMVPYDYSVSDLSFIFQNKKTKFVLVTKDNKILGLITYSDLFLKTPRSK